MKHYKCTQAGKKRALQLHQSARKNVPAYKQFLSQEKFPYHNSGRHFNSVPQTDKQRYIKAFPIEDRLYKNKKLHDYYMVCASAGTSGKPTLWPRDYFTDQKLEDVKEDLYDQLFQIRKKRTLIVITFGLGIWTAGMLTAKLSWPTAKNHKVSVVTPGMNKHNALSLIKALSPKYQQTIVLGYPPFLSDLSDLAKRQEIDLRKANIKIYCTGEHFSENWRIKMTSNVSKNNNPLDVVGFYACSDTGIIGTETPFTIKVLQKANQTRKLCRALFNSSKTPSLAAYNPHIKYLESVNNEIVITANQPVPLIRYNIHDRGGLLSYSEIQAVFKSVKLKTPPNNGNDQHFVYVAGRSDSVLLTANIYIEDIKYCIEHSKFSNFFSGKFKYGTEETSGLHKRLKIVLYTNRGKKLTKSQKRDFEEEFYKLLLEANDDFKMIQEGTKILKFKFTYISDEKVEFGSSKLHHFL